jgi:hypothetical protein
MDIKTGEVLGGSYINWKGKSIKRLDRKQLKVQKGGLLNRTHLMMSIV